MSVPDEKRGYDAVAMAAEDNVATALRALSAGETVRVRSDMGVTEIVAADPVSLGHKIALSDIESGAPVVKYGTRIGLATARIAAGSHVHTHNLISDRARRAGV